MFIFYNVIISTTDCPYDVDVDYKILSLSSRTNTIHLFFLVSIFFLSECEQTQFYYFSINHVFPIINGISISTISNHHTK